MIRLCFECIALISLVVLLSIDVIQINVVLGLCGWGGVSLLLSCCLCVESKCSGTICRYVWGVVSFRIVFGVWWCVLSLLGCGDDWYVCCCL